MKNKLLLFVILFVSLPTFAFASHDILDDVTLVSAVFGILSLMLFFKIWGATNDIDKIKRKVCVEYTTKDVLINVRKLHFRGKDDEAEALLEEGFMNNVDAIFSESASSKEAIEGLNIRYSELYMEYDKLYTAIGREFPSHFKGINYETYKQFGADFLKDK